MITNILKHPIFSLKPFQILLILSILGVLTPFLSMTHYRILYTISVIIKDLILWILPFSVCIFIATSLTSFKNTAFLFLGLLAIFEGVSNASSVYAAYGLFKFLPLAKASMSISPNIHTLTPYISLGQYKPIWWTPGWGAIVGLIVGLWNAYFNSNTTLLSRAHGIVTFIFTKILGRLIIIVIPGFIANLIYNDLLGPLWINSKVYMITMIIGVYSYVAFLFLLGSNFRISRALQMMKNAFPACITAFTTMCSIVTMPVTISNAEKNLKDKSYAQMIIPLTTNIQMIGDCFINAFLCLILLHTFNHPIPGLLEWSKFTFIFTLTRYTTTGVTGGAIFIMIPLYEKILGFSAEMSAIMLGWNLLLDPIVTSGNVYGNSALVVVFEKLLGYTTRTYAKLKSSV